MLREENDKESIPLGVQALRERYVRFYSPESRRKGLSLKTQPTDIICSNAHKAGTTWMMQILHGLRSGGSMEFEEIFDVCPVLEGALDYFYPDINQDQGFHRRVFCTHMGYPFVPKGAGKYIFIMRDPHDSPVSDYHFRCNWMFTPDEVSLDEFVEYIWLGRGGNTDAVSWPNQIDQIASWYPHRKDENVLWLHYEDMKADLVKCVDMISDFLNIGKDDSKLKDLVVKQASLQFMKEHKEKFDGHTLKKARNVPMGLDPNAGLTGHCGRTRAGQSGAGKKELSARVMDLIDKRWNTVLAPLTGCKNYSELRTSINKEFSREI